MHIVIVIIKVIAALCLVAVISGCSKGYRVSFGVAPISSITETQMLHEEEQEQENSRHR